MRFSTRMSFSRSAFNLGLGVLLTQLVGCGGELFSTSLEDESPDASAVPIAPADGSIETRNADEICNGYDDNDNGSVDEGCYCVAGEVQDCYPGPISSQITGICHMGQQLCAGGIEFGAWGECVGAVTPKEEIYDDGIDQDCDGEDAPTPRFCGDGECNGDETCDSCPIDCGECEPACNDGECNGDETCDSCPADCGECHCETLTFAVNARPVDIVWIIDQSGSMSGEIAMVKENMNGFSEYIAEAKVNYHVVLLAEKGGNSRSICIAEPLAGPECADGERFKQIDERIGSHDALQIMTSRIDDVESFLRPESLRHIIVVSDDNSRGVSASDFDLFLKNREGYDDYLFHGVVGLTSGSGVANTGRVYMELAEGTGGQLYHIAETTDWTELFKNLGQKVSEAAVTQYILSQSAIDDTLTVTYDDNSTVRDEQWTYKSSSHMIELKGTLPGDDTTIKVCYEPEIIESP